MCHAALLPGPEVFTVYACRYETKSNTAESTCTYTHLYLGEVCVFTGLRGHLQTIFSIITSL